MKNKLNYTIIANCQVVPISKILLKSEEFESNYNLIAFPEIQSWSKNHFLRFDSIINGLDLIITQPLVHERFGRLRLQELRSKSNKYKLIVIPSIYFNAYHPTLIHMKKVIRKKHKTSASQCGLVLYLYSKNKSRREACEIYSKISMQRSKEYSKILNDNLNSMIEREKEYCIDIKMSDFFYSNYALLQLMHIFNHPTNNTFTYLVNSILNYLNIKSSRTHLFKEELLANESFPIFQGVMEELGISFESELLTKNEIYFKTMDRCYSLMEYISLLYDFYDSHPDIVAYNYKIHRDKFKLFELLLKQGTIYDLNSQNKALQRKLKDIQEENEKSIQSLTKLQGEVELLRNRLSQQSKMIQNLQTGLKYKTRVLKYIWIIKRSGLFDKEWYLRSYPDVDVSGIDPVRHYITYGWRERRDPSPDFITEAYLSRYPDLVDMGVCPLVHSILHGK